MTARTLRIVEPAGAPHRESLAHNIADLRRRGFGVQHEALAPNPGWPYVSASIEERGRSLMAALLDPACDFVVAARGGYGVSDLLPVLDWDALSRSPAKCVVGLSDITALQLALFTRLGWRSLHGVMPGGTLWRAGSPDTENLIALLEAQPPWHGELRLRSSTPDGGRLDGVLLGGCLAVLTSLVATPYLPNKLDGVILFLEDVNENPGRIMRFWNQWEQTGTTEGLRAVVLGQLTGLTGDDRDRVGDELARRCNVPVLDTDQFGHGAPSFPLGIGAQARIEGNTLSWRME